MRRLLVVLLLSFAFSNPVAACGGKGDCKTLVFKCTDVYWNKDLWPKGSWDCIKIPMGETMAVGKCDEYGGQSVGHCGNVWFKGKPWPVQCGPGFIYNICIGPPGYTCYCPPPLHWDGDGKACK
jgi:hypothetical protein